MKQLGYLSIVLLLLGFLPAVLPEVSAPVGIAEAQPANMAPRTVTVQTGAGQDTVDLLAFLPEKVRIRVGDTVTWKMEGDIHTVSFATGTKPAGARHPQLPGPAGRSDPPRVSAPARRTPGGEHDEPRPGLSNPEGRPTGGEVQRHGLCQLGHDVERHPLPGDAPDPDLLRDFRHAGHVPVRLSPPSGVRDAGDGGGYPGDRQRCA